jgi:hypothetical protein
VVPISEHRVLRVPALVCVAALVPLLACSVDDRQLSEATTRGGGASAGAASVTNGGAGNAQGGAQNVVDAGDLDSSSAGTTAGGSQPPIAVVDGCPDLDTDGVADCQQTEVMNPDFARDVSGWSAQTGATLSWAAKDALSSQNSGSAVLSASGAVDAIGSSLVAASQCIALSGKQLVIAYGNAFIDAGQDNGGQAMLNVAFFDATACAGNPSSEFSTPAPVGATLGTWLTIQAGSVCGEGTQSARVELQISKPLQATTFQAHFDNILLKVRPPS